MNDHPHASFADPRAVDAFRALMSRHENVLDWMSHDEGLEHFDAFVTRKDAFRYLMHSPAGSLVLLYPSAVRERARHATPRAPAR
jgi:hypothetical protein